MAAVNPDSINLCGYCKTEVSKPEVTKYFLSQKVTFCSMSCFGMYESVNKERRMSKEYKLTPHPKDMAQAIEKFKKEEEIAKEKMFKGDN